MERFDRDVSAPEHPLDQRPEVLGVVSVDVALHVRDSVVDGLVLIALRNWLSGPRADRRLFVGAERVSVENGVLPADVFVDKRHEGLTASFRTDAHDGLTRFAIAATLDRADNGG